MTEAAFTPAEMSLVQATLRERYGRAVDVQEVETEIRMHPADRELTSCAALYWKEEGCDFVVSKTGVDKFRSMFFFGRIKDRYTTHPDEYFTYDNLGDCLVLTLKLEEDVARLRAQEAGST
jgi:hypothetical protein